MSFRLRPYQALARDEVNAAWAAGHKVVALRIPTGGGKTPTLGDIMVSEKTPSVMIAHRSELVIQASLTLARYGIRHRIIGPDTLHRACVAVHMAEIKRNYCDPNALAAVAGVDTLTRRDLGEWAKRVTLWIVDEGHHLLRSNKWGKAVEMFPNARGLLVTATVNRPDGKGLGRHAEGYADILVEGPELIGLQASGYLTPCRIFSPPSDVDLSHARISADGDFNKHDASAAIHASKRIVGDIVGSYLEHTPGKLGITFCVDIEHCHEVLAAYRAAGVPAEMITGDTSADPPLVRAAKMRRFRARQVLQLVNVDVLGEGVDVPAVEVVSMARPTNSYSVFAQQAGRMLRLMLPEHLRDPWDTFTDEQRRTYIAQSDKPEGILIDHVGNVARHAVARFCPDLRKLVIDLCHREWTLDSRTKEKGPPGDVIPLRTCTYRAPEAQYPCAESYPRIMARCPACGQPPEVAGRSKPQEVDGRLDELTPEALAALLAAKAHVDGAPVLPFGAPAHVQQAVIKRHHARQQAQAQLRDTMALWGGARTAEGESIAEAQSHFFLTMGVDVLSAQALGATEAFELEQRVKAKI